MAARIDPFIDVLLRERGDQLYLLPDEPVTMVKNGQSRRISKQPLTDEHIYALLVEMAPPSLPTASTRAARPRSTTPRIGDWCGCASCPSWGG